MSIVKNPGVAERSGRASDPSWKRLYRVLSEIEPDDLRVRPYISGDIARPDEIFVGVGRWMASDSGVEVPAPHRGLVVQNKGTRKRFGRSYASAARFAMMRPAAALDAWQPGSLFDDLPDWREHGIPPREVLSRMTLVVEDASPDSTFALLFALAWLAHCPEEETPRDWLSVVEAWERGVTSAGDPYQSWCALLSALVHSQFPVSTGKHPGRREFAAAWLEALRFTGKCLSRGAVDPNSVPAMPAVSEWVRAEAALRQEEQVYLGWLEHASVVQLSVPLTGAHGNRKRLCDALLFVEDQPAGAAKCFYRVDREKAPLGQGFQLAAHYRPHYRGSGNDLTITVDPLVGVDLTGLWEELERRENEKWGEGERPADTPRLLDYAPYEGGNRWNEPWYINPGSTLVAAPKRIGRDGPFGTRLNWEEVKEAVWSAFSPVASIRLKTADGPAVPLEELPPEPGADTGKVLFYAEWPEGNGEGEGSVARSLPSAPTIARVFAAMVQRGRVSGPIRLRDLPMPEALEQVPLSGGFAVVTQDGVFVLDDWRSEILPRDEIRSVFEAAAALDASLESLDRTAAELVSRMRAILARSRQKRSEIAALVRDSAEMRASLAEKRGTLAKPPADPDARRLRLALDRHWALGERFEALEATTREVETSLRALLELRTSEAARLLNVWGFPLGVSGLLAEPIARAIYQGLGASVSDDPPGWLTLTLFAVLSAVIAGLVLSLSTIRRRARTS